jgi:hypothetical protein
MLAKDDEIVADDDARVSFEIERVVTDGKTGKPVADIITTTRLSTMTITTSEPRAAWTRFAPAFVALPYADALKV